MCQAAEFKDIRFRAGEKKTYEDLNKSNSIRFPLEKVADPKDKVNILIQVRDPSTLTAILR